MKDYKKLYDYDESVIHAVHQWYIHNEQKYLSRSEIRELEPDLVLELFLEWEGIIGYTHSILSIVKAKEYVNDSNSNK